MAKELKDSLTHFMLNHSAIAPRNIEEVVCMSPEGDRYYEDLDKAGTKMQYYLLELYGQFYTILSSVSQGQPEDVLTRISKSKDVITRIIEHRITFCDNTRHALRLALAALDDQMNTLKDIHKANN
jgi:hypothetical protein